MSVESTKSPSGVLFISSTPKHPRPRPPSTPSMQAHPDSGGSRNPQPVAQLEPAPVTAVPAKVGALDRLGIQHALAGVGIAAFVVPMAGVATGRLPMADLISKGSYYFLMALLAF